VAHSHWGTVPVTITTVILEDRFCFAAVPHVMDLNFVQFCPFFFNPRERFKGRGVLGEKGAGLWLYYFSSKVSPLEQEMLCNWRLSFCVNLEFQCSHS